MVASVYIRIYLNFLASPLPLLFVSNHKVSPALISTFKNNWVCLISSINESAFALKLETAAVRRRRSLVYTFWAKRLYFLHQRLRTYTSCKGQWACPSFRGQPCNARPTLFHLQSAVHTVVWISRSWNLAGWTRQGTPYHGRRHHAFRTLNADTFSRWVWRRWSRCAFWRIWDIRSVSGRHQYCN